MSKIQKLPNGLAVLSGGTRTGIKLHRPWQCEIEADPAHCPFEGEGKPQVEGLRAEKGWRILENAFTPYPLHYLIVPKTCWQINKVRSLGGKSQITAALETARRALDCGQRERWLGVHVGPSAGQNLGHLHYHLLQPARGRKARRDSASIFKYCKSSGIEVFAQRGFRVVGGGFRAGQCFVYPDCGRPVEFTARRVADLAGVLGRLVELCKRKFASTEGLPPDFMVGIKFVGSKMAYGYYLPILNNWGFTEYFALLESTPFTLPWSHEESVAHLLSVG